MCGRLDQNRSPAEYARALEWEIDVDDSAAEPRFNVAPGTYRPLLHVAGDKHVIDDMHWGYRARFAAGKIPVAINARLEKLDNRYWGRLLAQGRAIVPADGWYEWTGDKGAKQPWHLHLKSRAPLFMAALADFAPFREHKAEAGFVVVTDDAQGGMVDVHDRRPVILSAEDAKLWLSPTLSAQQALHLARTGALGPEAFDWYPVSKDVGRAGNDGSHLAEPV